LGSIVFQKAPYIPCAMEYPQDLKRTALWAVDDQIGEDRPEPQRSGGEILPDMPNLGHTCKVRHRFPKGFDHPSCGARTVLTDEFRNLREIRPRLGGKDVSPHRGSRRTLQLPQNFSKNLFAVEKLTPLRLLEPYGDLPPHLVESLLMRDLSLLQ